MSIHHEVVQAIRDEVARAMQKASVVAGTSLHARIVQAENSVEGVRTEAASNLEAAINDAVNPIIKRIEALEAAAPMQEEQDGGKGKGKSKS
jgi:hypothetical protein